MAFWGIPSACHPTGTEDPSYAFLPRVARLVRRRDWWASIVKPSYGGGGLTLSSRSWSQSRWRRARLSERTECGYAILSEECVPPRARDVAEILGSPTGDGDAFARQISPPMTMVISPEWLAFSSSFSPYFLGASFEAHHFRASICNLAL